MIHGHLRLSVLCLLAKGEQSGYALMKNLQQEVGSRPSPGSIYPLLFQLHKEGLVTMHTQGKMKVYALTPAGTKSLKQFLQKKEAILDTIRGSTKLYDAVAGSNLASDIIEILSRVKSGKAPFGPLTGEMIQLRTLALKATKQDISKQQQQEIIHLLKDINAMLRKCCI